MLESFVYIMETVRENIFERFIIPGINISYWDFCLSLLVIGLVIKVLINGLGGNIRTKNSKSQKGSRGSSSSDNDN